MIFRHELRKQHGHEYELPKIQGIQTNDQAVEEHRDIGSVFEQGDPGRPDRWVDWSMSMSRTGVGNASPRCRSPMSTERQSTELSRSKTLLLSKASAC